MPDMHDPHIPHPEDRPPLTVIPVRTPPPRPPYPSPFVVFARWIFRTAFLVSVGLNFFLFAMLAPHFADGNDVHLYERFHSGRNDAADKVAVIRVDGVIMEGLVGYAHKQIEKAASDPNVKAIVLRINSPGG